MKKFVKYIAGVAIILASAFLYAHIDKSIEVYDKEVDTKQYLSTGSLAETIQEQEFVCQEDILDGIRIKCAVTGELKGAELVYVLKDKNTDSVVAEGSVDAEDIKHNKFYNIKFKQITGCKNKAHTFNVQLKNGTSEKTVSLYKEPMTEKGTKLSIGGVPQSGTMIMKTLSHRFDLETFIVVLCFAVYVILFIKILYKLFK